MDGSLVDRYFIAREQRIAAQRQVDAMEKEEKALKAEIIKSMRAESLSAIGGQVATVELKTKKTAKVEDWNAAYLYIQQSGHFQLLQRRMSETAVREFWDAGMDVPGVVSFPVDDLSLHKL